MIRLHVLTAVTRPENLHVVAHTLSRAATVPGLDLCWHWRYDLAREHVGGQVVKNAMLDAIDDGWVWILDDDTVAHPRLFTLVVECAAALPDLQGLVVSQQRADGRVLRAAPGNVVVGGIDAGQAVLHRDLIGDHRLPETYEGDGEFLSAVLPDARVIYLDQVLSFHNAIRPVTVALPAAAAA